MRVKDGSGVSSATLVVEEGELYEPWMSASVGRHQRLVTGMSSLGAKGNNMMASILPVKSEGLEKRVDVGLSDGPQKINVVKNQDRRALAIGSRFQHWSWKGIILRPKR